MIPEILKLTYLATKVMQQNLSSLLIPFPRKTRGVIISPLHKIVGEQNYGVWFLSLANLPF